LPLAKVAVDVTLCTRHECPRDVTSRHVVTPGSRRPGSSRDDTVLLADVPRTVVNM